VDWRFAGFEKSWANASPSLPEGAYPLGKVNMNNVIKITTSFFIVIIFEANPIKNLLNRFILHNLGVPNVHHMCI